MLTITDVQALPDFYLRVTLSNQNIITPCVAEYMHAPGYESLRADFAQAQVEEWGHAVEWPGDVAIPVTALYRLAKEQAGQAFTVQAFNRWMQDNHLSTLDAARVLGLAHHIVLGYHTGQKPIPPAVGVACAEYEARKEEPALGMAA